MHIALAILAALHASPNADAAHVRDFLPDRSVARAGASVGLLVRITNPEEAAAVFHVELQPPDGVDVTEGGRSQDVPIGAGVEQEVTWKVVARRALYGEMRLRVSRPGKQSITASFPIRFLETRKPTSGYIPDPVPAPTDLLIGAHHCPLWEADRPEMWTQIRKHMERVPALGFYAQESPEVSDWETKWAVEHGISFFIYCWYRTSQGGPVRQRFGSAIHEGLLKSRHAGKMKFTIMWENQSRGTSGVADEADLMKNLLPFWIDTYFKHPSYLQVDNKPVLFIYRPEFLIDDLGGVDKVVQAFDKMRQACRAAGFDGLTLLGEYRGLDPNHLRLMKSLSLDYTFAYCWYVGNNPTPAQAIAAQMDYIQRTEALEILPQVVTVSQAWSGWHDEGSIWKIPPTEFTELLTRAKAFVGGLPKTKLSGRMLLLDNWNEWGEGHYIAPYTEYGFGYLDAVRRVFSPNAGPHDDLIPEDLAMGPYDRPYRDRLAADSRTRRRTMEKVTKPGAPAAGLVGWWAFDEKAGEPAALDWSGNRLGAVLRGAARVPGFDQNGLECRGGCALVTTNAALSLTDALTIECRVRTDKAGQDNRWVVNRIFSGGVDSGYRLGILGGKPCFEIPQKPWSHHLQADVDLPTGRWVHLASTFDGKTMRIYVDGRLSGTMNRPGPVKPNNFDLCLGNFELNHQSYFEGILDEVKLWKRCLTPEEVRAAAGPPSSGTSTSPTRCSAPSAAGP